MSFTRAQLEILNGIELRNICKEISMKEPNNKEVKNIKNKKESQMIRAILNFEERRINYDLKILNNDKKVNYLFHISDVHIYPLARHKEYRLIFDKVYSLIEKLGIGEESYVVITGDLIHEKDNMKAENFILARDFLEKLNKLTCGVIIIAGNHDFIDKNCNRLDTITALVDRMGIYYLKHSGIYQIGVDTLFVVSSLIDGKFVWSEQVKQWNNMKKISLFHGMIDGVLLNEKITIDDGFSPNVKKRSYFDGFDFVLLGDIHKHQFIRENMAYAGSLIQQNWGETHEGHGLILWDLNKRNGKFIEIENEYGYINIDIRISQKGEFEFHPRSRKMPAKPRIKYHHYEPYSISAFDKARKAYEKPYSIQYTSNMVSHFVKNNNELLLNGKEYRKYDEIELVKNCLNEYIKNENDIKFIIDFHKELFHKELKKINEQKDREALWKVRKLEFRNILSYGGNKVNIIDFEEKSGATSISGENTIGKSNILKILLYALFKRINSGNASHSIVNKYTPKGAYIKVEIITDNYVYRITREIYSGKEHGKDADKGKRLNFEKFNLKGVLLGKLNQATDTQTQQKIIEIFGNYHSFLTNNVYSNTYRSNFIEMLPSDKLKELRDIFNLKDYENVRCEVEKFIKVINEKLAFIRGNISAYQGSNSKGDNKKLKELYVKKEGIDNILDEAKKSSNLIIKDIKNNREIFEALVEKSSGFSQEEFNNLKGKWYGREVLTEVKFVKEEDEVAIENRLIELDNVVEGNVKENWENIEILKKKIKIVNTEKKISFEEAEEIINKTKRNTILPTDRNENEIKKELNGIEKKDYISEALNKIREWRKNKKDELIDYVYNVIESGKIFKSEKRKQLEANLQWINYQLAVNVICSQLIKEMKLEIEKCELIKELGNIKHNNEVKEQKKYMIMAKQEHIFNEKEAMRKIIQQKEEELNNICGKINEYEKERALLEIQEKELKCEADLKNETAQIVKHLEERIMKMEHQLKLYQTYAIKLKMGIPTAILKQRIKEVEYCVNNILQRFVDYQINFTLDDADVKIPNVNLDIVKDGYRMSIFDISGAETFILNIVFRIALHKCSEYQKNGVFFIDEGFDCFDNNNFGKLGEIVEILKEEFSNVFLISHIKTIDEFTDNSIEIIKEDISSFISS